MFVRHVRRRAATTAARGCCLAAARTCAAAPLRAPSRKTLSSSAAVAADAASGVAGGGTTPLSMRAVVLPEPGPAGNLQYARRPVPQLSDYPGGAAEAARVRVVSCAVAYRDILDRTGAFPFMQRPTVLGHEFAGVVDSVGQAAEAAGLRVGDRVVSLHWAQQLGWPAPFDSAAAMETFLGLGCDGGYAEYCVTHHSAFVKVPDECSEWTPNEAASIVSTFGTVYQGAINTAGLPANATATGGGGRKRVLVTGAGGGVGSAAVQLISAGGHDVVAVTGSPSKRAYIEGLDRHHLSSDGGGGVTVVECLAGEHPDFSKVVLQKDTAAGGGGGAVDMVVENVGAPTIGQSLRCLRSGGQLVLIGNVTNSTFPLPLGLCIVKSLSVIGTDSCEAAEVGRLMQWMQARGLKPHVDRVLPLREAAAAHELVEGSAVEGRVVLAVASDGTSWDVGALGHLE